MSIDYNVAMTFILNNVPYTYFGTPYTTPRGEFIVLGQGDTIVFRGEYPPYGVAT